MYAYRKKKKKSKEGEKHFSPTNVATLCSIFDTKNKFIYRHKNCVTVTKY